MERSRGYYRRGIPKTNSKITVGKVILKYIHKQRRYI